MQLMLSPSPGTSAFPDADGNLLSWTATITGPTETPYEGLTFKLSFTFPNNYPYAPPTVLFKTPIYHPNFDFSGRICLDILGEKWSAVYNVQSVLLSLQSLLGEPNKYVPTAFPPLIPSLTSLTAQAPSTPKPPNSGIPTRRNSSVWSWPDTGTLRRSNNCMVFGLLFEFYGHLLPVAFWTDRFSLFTFGVHCMSRIRCDLFLVGPRRRLDALRTLRALGVGVVF